MATLGCKILECAMHAHVQYVEGEKVDNFVESKNAAVVADT